jgi:hypothetical protein
MKLPLATGFLSAATPADRTRENGRFRMRVDRVFDRRSQPWLDPDELTAESYREGAPSDRWEVAIQGSSITLTEMGAESRPATRLEGTEAWTPGVLEEGERRFALDQGQDGVGLFVVRGDEAELTLFGPGFPIVMSERGKLLHL